MNNLTITILFSLIALTLVGLALIPQMIIPDFYESVAIRKTAPKPEPKNVSTVPDGGCAAANYGLDCKITSYLEQNLIQPVNGGQMFCSYGKIAENENGAGSIIYLGYICQEFYLANGMIYEGSGQAGPARIEISGGGSISHQAPRDGSYFAADIKEMFPEEYRGAASTPAREDLVQMNRERAQNFFKAQFDFQIEKVTETACSYDFECTTPGEYLLMSRCPFTSKCVDGKCAIVCINSVKAGSPK